MKIKLPDGTIQEHPCNATAHDVAKTIGEGLANAAIGARVNGELVDVHRPIKDVVGDDIANSDTPIEIGIITAPRVDKKGRSKWRDEQHEKDALYLLRHSCAHVMAEAIESIWPDTQLAYGPPLDTGFYYDIKLDTPISSDTFIRIEEEMKRIVDENRPFTRYILDPDKIGFPKLRAEGNRYKLDNAQRAIKSGAKTLTWYITGEPGRYVMNKSGNEYIEFRTSPKSVFSVPAHAQIGSLIDARVKKIDEDDSSFTQIQETSYFEDLCQGPHVDRTGRIGAFKITNVAQSHWHGDITSDAFQRVYGTAFFTQADLDAHMEQLEQARQRDHRVLGQRLGLFTIDETVGQGLILWKPNGAVVRQELQNFIGEHLNKQGYSQVFTPHIGKLDLFKISGHFPYYQDSQYPPIVSRENIKQLADDKCSCADLSVRMQDGEIEGYLLKPMNCPFHIKIYQSEKRSYRDLPIRLAEFGTVYRWEQSGELGGMTRVRGFTQDDAHLFVTPEQLDAEVAGCLSLVRTVFNTLGMDDYRVRVGLRDPDSSKYVGKPEDWDAAERACIKAAESLGVPFSKEAGEAAFYGPKIDFVVKDVIGRSWQLGTVQVDYQLPQRFGLEYVGADNKTHPPVMIHRAPFGSMERFVGCLIEHFNGAFPLWLSPEQIRVLPVSDKFVEYANKVYAALQVKQLRVSLDDSNERVNAKIKSAQEAKVPYMLIVGGKDEAANTVSVRDRSKGDIGAIPLEQFVTQVCEERDQRMNESSFAV